MRPHPASTRSVPGRPASAHRQAFTLVEMLAAVVILGTLGTITASIMMRTASVNADTLLAQQVHSDLEAALERVDRLLREIPAKPSATTPYITSLAPTALVLGDGTTLALSGTDLQLTEPGQSAVTLLSDVSALSIAATNDVNTALAASLAGSACDEVRRISASITVTRGGVSDTLRTKVFVRCALSGAAPGS